MPRKLPENLPCGTAEKYRQHVRRGEPTDPACRAAHNEHNRKYYDNQQRRQRWVRANHRAEYDELRLKYLYEMEPYEYGYLASQQRSANKRAATFLANKYKDEIPDAEEQIADR